MWTTNDWVKKLQQQAEDSREYRHKLYEKLDISTCKRILDVGCGTGAVTFDITQLTEGEVLGIDIDSEKLNEAFNALKKITNVRLIKSDAENLPFKDYTFDLVVFNIVLMHIKDQQRAVHEMARVTKSGGHILGTLEPDYAAKIDWPEEPVTPLILKNLVELGADIYTGRKLKILFSNAGLETEVGIDTTNDFTFLRSDELRLTRYLNDFWIFEKLFIKNGWSKEQIEKYKEDTTKRIRSGKSFSFLPCFYAIGKKL